MTRLIDPHIGERYWNDPTLGKRILIYGESSYNRNGYTESYIISNQCSDLIDDVIGWPTYQQKGRFYNLISRIFGYDPSTRDSRKEFWEGVSYCNFLQMILKEPKEVPPHHLWNEGIASFNQTMLQLQPDYVFIFSKRLWQYIPKSNDQSISSTSSTYARRAQYELGNYDASRMFNFKHPSSFGFSWLKVREVIITEAPELLIAT